MSVINPSHVNYYLEIIVKIATFDPLPLDIFYEDLNIVSFNWVDLSTTRENFARIGVKDRNFLKTLGSLIFPILLLVFSQLIVFSIGLFTHYRSIKKLHKYLSLNGPLRPILILFFLECYLDLLIGGLINTENDYLFNVSGNWGVGGYLSFGDQFCVILGNIFYILCLMFPFFVVYTLSQKQ